MVDGGKSHGADLSVEVLPRSRCQVVPRTAGEAIAERVPCRSEGASIPSESFGRTHEQGQKHVAISSESSVGPQLDAKESAVGGESDDQRLSTLRRTEARPLTFHPRSRAGVVADGVFAPQRGMEEPLVSVFDPHRRGPGPDGERVVEDRRAIGRTDESGDGK